MLADVRRGAPAYRLTSLEQWHPVGSTPEQWQAQQAAEQAAAGGHVAEPVAEQPPVTGAAADEGGWHDGGAGDGTQIRPPS